MNICTILHARNFELLSNNPFFVVPVYLFIIFFYLIQLFFLIHFYMNRPLMQQNLINYLKVAKGWKAKKFYHFPSYTIGIR